MAVVQDLEGSLERLGLCFNDAKFSDVVVETEDGRKFLCHKNVLAATSPVFAAMLEAHSDSGAHSFKEAEEGKVVGVENRGLQGQFAKFIHDHFTSISNTEGFLRLSVVAIQHLLATSPTTFELCLALARWFNHDFESRRGIAGSLFSDLDFFSLNVDELKQFGALKEIEGLDTVQRDIQQVNPVGQKGGCHVLMEGVDGWMDLKILQDLLHPAIYVSCEAINVWKLVDSKGHGRVSIWKSKRKPSSEEFEKWLT
ncbi:hypothetical protein BSKO_12462 [Bryopsis sp. KO-2023]|nr:hypothetical protein BSKO_12462 [Bryopsis sp. KO-2023]